MASYSGANNNTSSSEQKEADRTHRALLDYARTTKDDLYTLLDLPNPYTASSSSPPGSSDPSKQPPTEPDIKAAWRRSALKHHPDKNRGHESLAATKLDSARRAFDVLKDPEARKAYDARLEVERQKKEREGALGERRRKMMVELEMRERNRHNGMGTPVGTPGGGGGDVGSGFRSGSPRTGEKRARGGGTPMGNGESVLRRERMDDTVRQLAAEGARRRAEMEERMRKRKSGGGGADGGNPSGASTGGGNFRDSANGDANAHAHSRPSTPTPTSTTATNGVGENDTPNTGKKTFTFTPPTTAASKSASASAAGTPVSASKGASATKTGGSLYESTMRKLKEAQERKKRMELEKEKAQRDADAAVKESSATDEKDAFTGTSNVMDGMGAPRVGRNGLEGAEDVDEDAGNDPEAEAKGVDSGFRKETLQHAHMRKLQELQEAKEMERKNLQQSNTRKLKKSQERKRRIEEELERQQRYEDAAGKEPGATDEKDAFTETSNRMGGIDAANVGRNVFDGDADVDGDAGNDPDAEGVTSGFEKETLQQSTMRKLKETQERKEMEREILQQSTMRKLKEVQERKEMERETLQQANMREASMRQLMEAKETERENVQQANTRKLKEAQERKNQAKQMKR
ncbi:MAG: hypothetical protein M1831_004343 [Alyxoria varia]|nr:MAG: hypothetical protein M1831_004343 [Alyxoria varia]